MGFVHHEQRRAQSGEPFHGLGFGELLRCEEEERGISAFQRFPGLLDFGVRAGGIDHYRGARSQHLKQAIHLVLLQSNQG